VSRVMNFRVPYSAENFLIRWRNLIYLRSCLSCGVSKIDFIADQSDWILEFPNLQWIFCIEPEYSLWNCLLGTKKELWPYVSGLCYYYGHMAENRIASVKISSVELKKNCLTLQVLVLFCRGRDVFCTLGCFVTF
jgi:hypothetical protein